VLLGAAASAQTDPSPARLWLTGGLAYRDHTQLTPAGAPFVHIGGTPQSIAPWNLHFSGALFFNRVLGVNVEARGELFYATQARTQSVPQPGLELTPSAAARWVPVRWLSLEAQLGWALQLRSIIVGGPQLGALFFTGPSLGVAIGLVPGRQFSGQLFLRAQPVNFLLGGSGPFSAQVYAAGAQFSIGAVRLGMVQLGGAVTLEFTNAKITSSLVADQLSTRVGVGVSLSRVPDEVSTGREPVVTRGTLAGHAQSPDGTALPGVVVSLDGEDPVRSDEAGAFTFSGVSTGVHVLRARKEGLQSTLLEVSVASPPVPVTLTLTASTGPGRIRGVVRSAAGPVAGAVLVAGELKVISDAEGHFVLEGIGPGPVSVQALKEEFTDAAEVVQVPAAGEATLDFLLVPRTTEVRATLRGLIRAKSGEVVKATVRVVELKLKLAVKTDGRFSADVPSGKYTLVIEARGFVTQTKTVEVSGGDQAIFHAELEPAR
jgi:hypothetical protein